MEKDIKIRNGSTSDLGDIMSISKSLNDWFNEDGIKYIEQDFAFEKTIIAEVDSKPIGFLSYFTYEGIGYLGWIGVYENYHGSGAGKLLFDEFEKIMKKDGINTLQVKTLGESVLYPPYDRTRSFYKKVGFTKHRSEFTENPGCPEELILRKII
jgi:GNAT superfamily N-acetyltransferase